MPKTPSDRSYKDTQEQTQLARDDFKLLASKLTEKEFDAQTASRLQRELLIIAWERHNTGRKMSKALPEAYTEALKYRFSLWMEKRILA